MAISVICMRRDAQALRSACAAGERDALARVEAVLGTDPKAASNADALRVLAREAGYASWSAFKFAAEAGAMDRAGKLDRLKMALFHGQGWRVERLLEVAPDLRRDNLGIMCALYDVEGAREALDAGPKAVSEPTLGPRSPILHLAFSRWWRHGGSEEDMLATADVLKAAGANVNDSYEQVPGNPLSALYGAVGHASNLRLAAWLLENGADPDDGESLYHACEVGAPALRILLDHGARITRTNALPRALDFNDPEMVEALLERGADPNESVHWPEVSGEAPFVIPALHQAARRLCSRRIVARLLDAGGNPDQVAWGHSAYALARMFGNDGAAKEMASRGCRTDLGGEEVAIADAVAGRAMRRIDPERLPEPTRDMIRSQIHLPHALRRTKALVEIGLPHDRPDPQGLTPVQVAGWEGIPDVMEHLLSLGVSLDHVNGYGGDLMSTIVHGSENAPGRRKRDHVACARLALESGVPLRRREIEFAGEIEMAEFLNDWAEDHPDQVTEDRLG
ncbi:MAG: ankyrin repeat domain-containing protein [Boseongicola sp. SB0662_bin_57]|nr:ankyrin repeat domain-containing protein [Boseongicola sp. SB0662_bin_57]